MKLLQGPLLALCLAGAVTAQAIAADTGTAPTAYQVSTLDTLLSGGFEGETSVQTLLQHGDTGLGTFNDLDGEMIVLGGVAYQIKSSGQVALAAPTQKTPFAFVSFFSPGQVWEITQQLDEKQFTAFLDAHLPPATHYFLIRAQGEFAGLKTRSVPRQHKPYPRLEAVLPQQAVFEFKAAQGILVGFRSPGMQKSTSGAGYHFHFLNTAKTAGGHALAFTLSRGKVEVEEIRELHLVLPEEGKLSTPVAAEGPKQP